jgi:adenosylcobinamide amidohydrolase
LTAAEHASSAGLRLERAGRWLRVCFPAPHRTLGWTIVGGGWRTSDGVSWLEVSGEELAPPVDARTFVLQGLAAERREEEPVLVTGCALDHRVTATAVVGDVAAACVATIGLGNALRAGDPPVATPAVHTINLLCRVSAPLTDLGLLEALGIAVEARTAAVLEAAIPSSASGGRATGTGTDCVVVAAPLLDEGSSARAAEYAGKHTAVGAAIGAAVLEAISAGVAAWCERHRGR